MLRVEISRAALAAIRDHAASDPTREVCGLLFGSDGRIDAIEQVDNVAGDPATRFEIDPKALFRAARSERAGGPRLIGYYHSHPSGVAEPSEIDRARAALNDKLWLVAAGDEVTAWRASTDGLREVPLQLVSEREGWPGDSVSATRPS